jgi:hypothetical protein
MLGIAIRIAQRMGINSEAALANCNLFEAEMRRRLWWAMVLFDDRICQLAETPDSALSSPRWDCRIPLNVNDSDLRPEMKHLPAVQESNTDLIYLSMRSEIGDFVRDSASYHSFSIGYPRTRSSQPEKDLHELERKLEDKYLNSCDPENAVQFMTMWTARSLLATYQLRKQYFIHTNSTEPRTKEQLDDAMLNALSMLECDTKIISSKLITGFRWCSHLHFPFIAYIHIISDLKCYPHNEHAERAWKTMSDNFDTRFMIVFRGESPFLRIFGHRILQAWAAREAASEQSGDPPPTPPKIVSSIHQKMTEMDQTTQQSGSQQPEYLLDAGMDNYLVSMPTDLSGPSLLHGMENESFNYTMHTELYAQAQTSVLRDCTFGALTSTMGNQG